MPSVTPVAVMAFAMEERIIGQGCFEYSSFEYKYEYEYLAYEYEYEYRSHEYEYEYNTHN